MNMYQIKLTVKVNPPQDENGEREIIAAIGLLEIFSRTEIVKRYYEKISEIEHKLGVDFGPVDVIVK